MMSLDAYYSENPDSELYQVRTFSGTRDMSDLFPYFGDVLHCFDYGNLSSALIRGSETDVRRLLGQSTDYILEKGHQGQTPLHISAGWPLGLNILFELAGDACRSIINVVESTGIAPIDCAIHLHQAESIVILLKNNAAIDLEDPSVYLPTVWNGHARRQTKEVCDLLAVTLADRRKRLLHFALDQLPKSELVRLDLWNISMLQCNAFEVVQAMKSNGIQPLAVCGKVQRGSIYHSSFMDDTLTESLYEAGFDVVDLCWNGYTPLMIHRFDNLSQAVRLISWFSKKHANLLAIIPGTFQLPSSTSLSRSVQFRVIHRLASILGYHTISRGLPAYDSSLVHSQYLILMREVLSKVSRDPCQCYCAPEGCDSTSLFTKTWFKYHMQTPFKTMPRFDNLDMVLELISEEQDKVQATFVRVCTFDRLGMRHTCCTHDLSSHNLEALQLSDRLETHALVELVDHMEVGEIQEEDRYLASTLDTLMIEFRTRLQDTAQSFHDFWKWWNKRMDEMDAEKGSIPHEDIQAMVDIGVRLEA
ncbi:hypothetical protein CGCTS75_v014768 [Colletotrichum tropicale]|nr:hypothetical protein CGCTS75_v014768 [Colletotrichum tropicale]